MDSMLKSGVEDLFGRLGLTASSAITLFYQQVLFANGLPFQVLVPNEVTEKALQDAEEGRDVRHFDSIDSLFTSLKEEACQEQLGLNANLTETSNSASKGVGI